MHKSLEFRLFAAFALVLALVAAGVAASVRNARQMEEAGRAVTASRALLGELEGVLRLMVDRESGQRGYTIAGTEVFLQPYHEARTTIEARLDALRRSVADRPAQSARLAALEPLLAASARWQDEVLAAARDRGLDAARRMVGSGEGKRRLDAVRVAIAGMAAAEAERLAAREAASRAADSHTRQTLAALAVLVAGIVTGSYLLLRRHLQARTRAEAALRASEEDLATSLRAIVELNETLEQRVRERTAELAAATTAQAESARRYRAVFEQAAVGIARVGLDGRWLEINDRLCAIVGYSRAELMGLGFQDITHPDDLDADLALVRRVLGGEIDSYSMEKRYLRKAGGAVWIDLTVALVRRESGQPDYFVSVVEDITTRKQAQEKLRRSAEELRQLSARLAESQETERASLSKELHDRVGQNLTALNINLSILESQLPEGGGEPLKSRLHDSLALIEDTARRVRDVMADLRPPLLDQYGLVPALHAWAGAFAQRTGIAASVSAARGEARAAAAVETALFRIAQEALNNVAKHAAARAVEIRVEPSDGGQRLTVRDDGRGFDPAGLEAPGRPPSWGMITMRERAQAVGGRLRVESAPGLGTRVIVDFPGG